MFCLFLSIDSLLSPCLWVGTVYGNVFVVVLSLPAGDERDCQPVLSITTGRSYCMELKNNLRSGPPPPKQKKFFCWGGGGGGPDRRLAKELKGWLKEGYMWLESFFACFLSFWGTTWSSTWIRSITNSAEKSFWVGDILSSSVSDFFIKFFFFFRYCLSSQGWNGVFNSNTGWTRSLVPFTFPVLERKGLPE